MDENWACRRVRTRQTKTISIANGNGSWHPLLLKFSVGGLRLEYVVSEKSHPDHFQSGHDLVCSCVDRLTHHRHELQGQYLVCLNGTRVLDMARKVHAAGARRSSAVHRIPLQHESMLAEIKGMRMLEKLHRSISSEE
jgi:hypothetical protein